MTNSGASNDQRKQSVQSLAQAAANEVSEQPDEETKAGVAKAEKARRGKSAGVRADECQDGWIGAIESERDRLLARVKQLEPLVPRCAELTQAERTSKLNAGLGAVCNTVGAAILGFAQFVPNEWNRWTCIILGISLTAVGVSIGAILRFFHWPTSSIERGNRPAP